MILHLQIEFLSVRQKKKNLNLGQRWSTRSTVPEVFFTLQGVSRRLPQKKST